MRIAVCVKHVPEGPSRIDPSTKRLDRSGEGALNHFDANAVGDAIKEPRYPSLKGIMGAKKKPQDVLSLGELGVDAGQAGEAGSRTTVLALGDPPARGDARKIEGDGNAAQAIIDFIAEKRLI